MAVRFTEKAEKVLATASSEARQRFHGCLGTEHILFGIATLPEGLVARALPRAGVDVQDLLRTVSKALDGLGQHPHGKEVIVTPHAKRCLEIAREEAVRLGHQYVGTEHLLIGLAREKEGAASRVFAELGIDTERLQEAILSMLGADEPKGSDFEYLPTTRARPTVLESFSIDLTDQARQNKLGPIIGRLKEINRLIQILSRKTKNNPVVLGEPGVGKTAIIEGLAQRIAGRDIPEVLAAKRIVRLDLAQILAGTKYRGEFEKRLKSIIKEVMDAKSIILFIDEIHTIMGAGASESSLDASNILKPSLSRGDIQCIGATTLDEYRKYIEKDGAMERRFQTLIIDPPSPRETVEILQGLRDTYEAHHRIRITDEAILAAVDLSTRYISGRFLPDKAIDVVDETCARERLKQTTKPPDVTDLENTIQGLEREKDEAVHAQDFEVAADLRDRAEQLKTKRDEILRRWKKSSKEIDGVVGEPAVAETIALMTGIPQANLQEAEAERLMRMEEVIGEMVMGQETAIQAVCRAIRRSRTGLKDPNRPLGSFIFIGPSGVGKTLLAKALASFLFGSEDSLIQIDMSEYMERHNISRLIGSPPGYVGYEEGGQLTEKIRRKPYSVVLLDEVEKAHPEFANMLLQILEEGRLTDSFGRFIDFKNTIIIMTSNLGARGITDRSALGFSGRGPGESEDTWKERLAIEITEHFRPEFLNRIDDVVIFNLLQSEDVRRIFQVELGKVEERLKKRRLRVELESPLVAALIEKGYNDRFGARGIRRVIEERIEDPISELILLNKIKDGDTIRLRWDDEGTQFDVVPPGRP